MRTFRAWFAICGLFLWAQDLFAQADDFTYETNGDAITITGYSGLRRSILVEVARLSIVALIVDPILAIVRHWDWLRAGLKMSEGSSASIHFRPNAH
jgi:hypothetical protein